MECVTCTSARERCGDKFENNADERSAETTRSVRARCILSSILSPLRRDLHIYPSSAERLH
jgi:hypothetical protein